VKEERGRKKKERGLEDDELRSVAHYCSIRDHE
jgi:hypothetical protein